MAKSRNTPNAPTDRIPEFGEDLMERFQSMLVFDAMADIGNFFRNNQSTTDSSQHQSQLSPSLSSSFSGRLTSSASALSASYTIDRGNDRSAQRSREVNFIPHDHMELVRNPAFDMEDSISVIEGASSSSPNHRQPQQQQYDGEITMMLPALSQTDSVQRYLENAQLTAPTSLSTCISSDDELVPIVTMSSDDDVVDPNLASTGNTRRLQSCYSHAPLTESTERTNRLTLTVEIFDTLCHVLNKSNENYDDK